MNTKHTVSSEVIDTLWTSPNGLWSIEVVETIQEDQSRTESKHIYNHRQRILWPINQDTATNPYYPGYVRKAIAAAFA